jgi:hypothetical protein
VTYETNFELKSHDILIKKNAKKFELTDVSKKILHTWIVVSNEKSKVDEKKRTIFKDKVEIEIPALKKRERSPFQDQSIKRKPHRK